MHTHKLSRFERQRRRQAIGLAISIGLITAAFAGVAIYLMYQTAHMRM